MLLIQDTLYSIRHFLIILFVWYMMFGSAFFILNWNRHGDDDELVPNLFGFWLLDAFMMMYELSLGEFMVDSYREVQGHTILVYTLFFASTFLIQITFLNMLIAIMGDTFTEATEEKENNARQTKLKIMGDYIDLINKDDIDEEDDEMGLVL